MIEIICGGHGEGKTVEAVHRAASWVRNGGTVFFLTPTRYSASHVEQVANLIEHEVPGAGPRFSAHGVANLAEVREKLADVPRDHLLVVVDGASDLIGEGLLELRRAGIRPGLQEMLALTFDFARSVEAMGYRVLVTLAAD
jgi:hypothetical protein